MRSHFAKNLKNLLHEREVSKGAFAIYLNVSRSTLDDYLSEKTFMTSDKIERTADFFGVTVGFLFRETENTDNAKLLQRLDEQQQVIIEQAKKLENIANSLQNKIT